MKYLYLFYIKRCDAFNNASLGTNIGKDAKLSSMPYFPHGINGVVISENATLGSNCTIFHQVTIGMGKDGAPTIGDNCFIGAGAKIIGKINIGNNVKVGAGCVVYTDVPDGATVVCAKSRIIIKENKE